MKNFLLVCFCLLLVTSNGFAFADVNTYMCGNDKSILLKVNKDKSVNIQKKNQNGTYSLGQGTEPTQPGYIDYLGKLENLTNHHIAKSVLHLQQEVLDGKNSGRIRLDRIESECKKSEVSVSELQPIQPERVTSINLLTLPDPNPSLRKDGKCSLKGTKAKEFFKKIEIGQPFKPDSIPAAVITGNLTIKDSGQERSFQIYNQELLYEGNQKAYFKLGKALTLKVCISAL